MMELHESFYQCRCSLIIVLSYHDHYTYQNLLQAVETSKTNTRDATRAVQTEARLRKELVNVQSQRDDAMSESIQAQRQVAMLTDEVKSWKLGNVRQSD